MNNIVSRPSDVVVASGMEIMRFDENSNSQSKMNTEEFMPYINMPLSGVAEARKSYRDFLDSGALDAICEL